MPLRELLEDWGVGKWAERFEAAGLEAADLEGLTPEELADDLGLDLAARARFCAGRGGTPRLGEPLDRWLAARGLDAVAGPLAEAGVDAETFPYLVASDLRSWDRPLPLSQRRRLIEVVRRLWSAPAGEEGPTPDEEALLHQLPFPVAYPLRFALDPSEPVGLRLDNLILTALQALRLTTLLLLADYLAGGRDRRSPSIDASLSRSLDRPTWGDWSTLCGKLSKHWLALEKDSHASAFPGLAEAWRVVGRGKGCRTDWKPLLQKLPGVQSTHASSANQALWRARNDLAHRATTRRARSHEDGRRFALLRPVLRRVLQELFPSGRVALYRQGKDGPELLEGCSGGLAVPLEELPQPLQTTLGSGRLVAWGAGRRAVSLRPLARSFEVRPGQALGERLTRDLGLLDGVSAKRAVYVGVHETWELQEPATELLQRFHALGIEVRLPLDERLNLGALLDRSRDSACEQLSTLRGRRYFPEWYHPRSDAEEALRQHLRDGKGEGLLFLGPSGSGKSSLLAHCVGELLGEGNDSEEGPSLPATPEEALVIAYLLGHAFPAEESGLDPATALAEAFCARVGVQRGKRRSLLEVLEALQGRFRGGGRLLLAIDGLNEAPRFEALADALRPVLEELHRFPWLRLVLTLRDDAAEVLERTPAGLLHAKRWKRFVRRDLEGRIESRPGFVLDSFAEEELEEAYERRRESEPERSCKTPFAELPGPLREPLCSPLQHHLFHLAYAEEPAPEAWDEGEATRRVLDRLVREQPDLREVLHRAGQHMFERRRAALSASFVDAALRRWAEGRSPSERTVCFAPFEALEAAGLLLRPSRSPGAEDSDCAYVFAHERVAERLLLNYVESALWGEPANRTELLLRMSQNAAGVGHQGAAPAHPFPPLLAALAELWGRQAAADDQALPTLLQLEEPQSRARLLTEALLSLLARRGEEGEAEEERGRAQDRTLERLFSAPPNRALERFERLDVGAWRAQVSLARRGGARAAVGLARRRVALLEAAQEEPQATRALDRALARSYTHLASVLRRQDAQGTVGERRDVLERALELANEAGTEDADAASERAYVLGELARAYADEREFDRARAHSEEAVALLRDGLERDPEGAGRREALAFALNALGNFCCRAARQGDADAHARAVAAHDEARALIDALRPPLSSQAREILSFALGHLAELEQLGGDLAAARAHALRALEVAREVLGLRPRDLRARANVAYAEKRLAEVHGDLGEVDEACRHAEAARESFSALVRDEPRNVRYARGREGADALLARLRAAPREG